MNIFLISFQPIQEETNKNIIYSQLSTTLKNFLTVISSMHETEQNPELLLKYIWRKRRELYYQILTIFQHYKYQLIINNKIKELKDLMKLDDYLYYNHIPLSLETPHRKIDEWINWKDTLLSNPPVKESNYWLSVYCNAYPGFIPLYIYHDDGIIDFYKNYIKNLNQSEQLIFNASSLEIKNIVDENLLSSGLHEGSAPQQCVDISIEYLSNILKIFNYFTLYYDNNKVVDQKLHKELSIQLLRPYTINIAKEVAKNNLQTVDPNVYIIYI